MLLVATLVLAFAWLWLRLPKPAAVAPSLGVRRPSAGADAAARRDAAIPQLDAASGGLSEMLHASRHLSIVATDVHGLITLFTAGAEALLGYTSDEVVGKMSVLALHDGDELRARARAMGVEASFDVFRALPNLGLCDEREWSYMTKDGRRIPVALTVSRLLGAGGAVSGYVGMGRDLRAAKAVARDRDGFFAVCQELLLKVDRDGRILTASPSFLRVLGYHPHELEGQLLTDYVHAGDAHATVGCLDGLKRGQAPYQFENRWRDKAGSYHTISWDGTTPDENGVCYGGGLDVTHKKRREAEREESLAVEKRLMGIVSHDLRNPLTTISMAAQLIERAPQRHEAVLRNVARILQSCRRAETLIHDVLDFSQARHLGGIKVRLTPVDLAALVRRVVDELAMAHPGRDIQVQAPVRLVADADGDKLSQLLSNLLTNGLKYGPTDLPVRVRLDATETGCALEVTNGGPPIAPQLVPHLFEPFRRGRDDDGHQHSVGLGLYIVAEVARAHGGQVQVRSDAQAGTTFRVVWPRRGAHEAAAPGTPRLRAEG